MKMLFCISHIESSGPESVNGISRLYDMLEMYYFGLEPLIPSL